MSFRLFILKNDFFILCYLVNFETSEVCLGAALINGDFKKFFVKWIAPCIRDNLVGPQDVKVVCAWIYLLDLKARLCQVLNSVRRCVWNIAKDHKKCISFFCDGYRKDDAFVFILASESYVDFTNSIYPAISRVLMLFKFYVYLLWPQAVCPMKNWSLTWICFEYSFLLAFSLNDLDCWISFINNHIPRLELDDLRKAERSREVLDVGDNLVHAIGASSPHFVLQQNRLTLELCLVERKISPVRITNLHRYVLNIVCKPFFDCRDDLSLFVLDAHLLNYVIWRVIREQHHTFELALVFERCLVQFYVWQLSVHQRNGLLVVQLLLEVDHLYRRLRHHGLLVYVQVGLRPLDCLKHALLSLTSSLWEFLLGSRLFCYCSSYLAFVFISIFFLSEVDCLYWVNILLRQQPK